MRISKSPEERRSELIAAARALFDERGIDKTRVSDIVKQVGVAQGVFYYYFDSKEQMVEVVLRQVADEITTRMDAILAADASFVQKLADYIHLYAHVIDQFLPDDATSLRDIWFSPIFEGSLAGHNEALLAEGLRRLVRQGVQNGHLTIAHAEETALVLLYGLRCYGTEELPGWEKLFSIVEQTFALPKNSLTALA